MIRSGRGVAVWLRRVEEGRGEVYKEWLRRSSVWLRRSSVWLKRNGVWSRRS